MKGKTDKKMFKKRNPKRKGSALLYRIKALERNARDTRPEKKCFLLNNSGASDSIAFGQVKGNSSGFFSMDCTCYPPQGGGESQRIGNDITHTSMRASFQVNQQANLTGKINMKIWVLQIVGNPQSNPAGLATVLFNPNPFTNGTIYDYHSTIDNNYFRNVRVLGTKKISIGDDRYSGQRLHNTYQFGLKFKKPIKVSFSADGSVSTPAGSVYLYIMCDGGNCDSATTSTISNLPHTTVSTGLTLNYNILHYYTDV
jgi:hypothetical protein